MNKLKTGKGALKDYHRCLADEYDDYAEEPQESDPIVHITQSNTYQKEIALQKTKTQKVTIKKTTHWPKYQPDFNFVVASGRIFEGLVGEKFVRYLKVSDVVKLLRTCQYLNKIFSKTSIWIYFLTKSYGYMDIPTSALSSIDIIQYSKYLRFAKDDNIFLGVCEKLGMINDGIVFDTVVIERDMKNEEEKYLARNIVDSVTVKNQKTIETINKLALNGTLTGDMKISWMKDANQVCVWMAGYQVQNKNLRTIPGIFFKKKYDGESQLVTKTYFLNDRYFVIESEDREYTKAFEVYVMEPEDNWFEKINVSLCKQVFKQTFTEKTKNIQVKNIGNSLVFLSEREKNVICVQVFDINRNDESVYKSEDLHLDADLSDAIPSKCVTQQEGSWNLYLVDKESNVYLLNYNIESGVTIKKMDQQKIVKEEEKQELQLFNDKENQRFSEPVRRYSYGTFKAVNQESQNITIEYLMVYKEKQFYFTKFNTNELVHCDLPEYNATDSRFYNWTICRNYLYLLFHASIQIYQLDYLNYSAILYKKEALSYPKFKGSNARWIFVNPCMTVIMSAGSFDEGFVRSLQLWTGSTQNLLLIVNPDLDTMLGREKANLFNNWDFDECRLDKILAEIEDKTSFGKETIECKFEDERLLIQTNFRSYFRDFNVGEKRVNEDQYAWKSQAIYNLDDASALNLPSGGIKQNSTKKNSFVSNLLAHENKNSNGKMKKNECQNWKNVEKKEDTEEKLEKKESRKKGDKYYKNVRQGKHRQKMSD